MASSRTVKEVMTLSEVADYLQLSEKSILRMLGRGEIPAAKVASQWRFMRSVIHDWLASRTEGVSMGSVAGRVERLPIYLGKLIREDLVVFDVKPGSVEAVLRQLTAPLVSAGVIDDEERLLKNLLYRESLMSTAMGEGVAIPHPRRPLRGMFAEPTVVLGICPEGTDFQAIDGRPVHVFFLVCAPREDVHLQVMAKVATLVRRDHVIERLSRASSRDEVAAVLEENS